MIRGTTRTDPSLASGLSFRGRLSEVPRPLPGTELPPSRLGLREIGPGHNTPVAALRCAPFGCERNFFPRSFGVERLEILLHRRTATSSDALPLPGILGVSLLRKPSEVDSLSLLVHALLRSSTTSDDT